MTRPSSPASGDIDPVAMEILFRKHWSPRGWTKGQITSIEFDRAKQAGLMFDPVDLCHDDVVARAIDIRGKITPDRVGIAFLASLSSRRMDYRSALGSLAAILHLPAHSFVPRPHSNRCAVCGDPARSEAFDLNVLSFERLKWGGVRHESPSYAVHDLEWFSALPPAAPGSKGHDIIAAMLDRIFRLSASARPADLEKSLGGLLPSNTSERRIIISILSLAGVILPKDRPTFWGEYPLHAEREQPSGKNDWPYPVLWWTGVDGINRDALRYWFPDIG
jgi:hypothetical protein